MTPIYAARGLPRKKVAFILGARPEAIGFRPRILAMRRHPAPDPRVYFTGSPVVDAVERISIRNSCPV